MGRRSPTSAGDPAVRAARDRGRRAHASARATSAARGRSRCSRSCSPRAAIASRPTGSRSSSGGRAAAQCRRLASDVRLDPAPPPHLRPRRARELVVTEPEATASRPTWSRSTSTASTRSSSAPRASRPERGRALARGGARARARRRARGRAVRRLGPGSAQHLPGPGPRRPPRRRRRGTRRARLRRLRSPTPRRRRARPPSASGRTARMLALYALGRSARGARPLPHASGRGSTRSSGSSRRPRRGRSSRRSSARRTSARCCRARSGGQRRAAADQRCRLLGRTAELDTLVRAVRRRARRRPRADPDRGETRGSGRRACSTSCTERSADVRVGCAECSELEQHLPYVPLATALRTALAGADARRRRLPALGQILPELALGAPDRPFEEVEVLEALVAVVAEHGPLVLLIDDLHWADPADARRAQLPATTRRRPLGGAGDDSARPRDAAGRPLGSLRPDTSYGSSRSPAATWPRSGCPTCTRRRAATRASSPRRSRTSRQAGALADAHRGADRPVPRRGRRGAIACWSPPRCSSSRSSRSRSPTCSVPTAASSSRSSSGSASSGSCASTGSASGFGTTLCDEVLLGSRLACPAAAAARQPRPSRGRVSLPSARAIGSETG